MSKKGLQKSLRHLFSFFFFYLPLQSHFQLSHWGKGRVGFPDNPISKRQARRECERTGAEEWLPKRLAFDSAE